MLARRCACQQEEPTSPADAFARLPAPVDIGIGARGQVQAAWRARPPAELPVAPRPSRSTRLLVVLLASLAALTCFGGVALLWTTDSPGIAFNLMFTVMGVGFGLGLLVLAAGWRTTAAAEEVAKESWLATPPTVSRHGVVVDREVRLQSETGAVSQIHLLVRVDDEQVAASWHARGRGALLPPQVPGTGSRTRVWRSNAGPVLVEVADPSVVTAKDAR